MTCKRSSRASIQPDECCPSQTSPLTFCFFFATGIARSPRFYSADKKLFFSGTVICTAEVRFLPFHDLVFYRELGSPS